MKKLAALSLSLTLGLLQAGEIDPGTLILKNGAKLIEGVLQLDGKNAYAEVPGTENACIGKDGLTLACAVKFSAPSHLSSVGGKDNPAGHDMLFSKGKDLAYIFGRRDTRLYANCRNKDNKFSAPFYADFKPEPGTWYHICVVYEYFNDAAQGDVGYITKIYVNGDLVGKNKFSWLVPGREEGRIEIGKGWGGVWMLNGEISNIFIEKKSLNDAEIIDLVSKCPQVKIKTYRKENPELKDLSAASPAGQWLIRSLNAAPSGSAVKIAGELKEAFLAKEDGETIRLYGKDRHGVLLYAGKEILILLNCAGQGSPVLGIYDRTAKRPVLEDRLFGWEIRALRDGKKESIVCDDLDYTVSRMSDSCFKCTWTAGKITVTSQLDFSDDSVSADLRVENDDPSLRIEQVVFPCVRFARAGEDDCMLYPYMCGALVHDPTRNTFSRGQLDRIYPSAQMTMQFSAYYGNGRGTFLGWDDPHGTTKNFSAAGRRGGLEMNWVQDAKYTLEQKNGGNSYVSPGRIVLKVYSGEWFEACKIHRAAMRGADWFIRELPRQDTPAWYRDAPIVMKAPANRKDQIAVDLRRFEYLRKYFDVPIIVNIDRWDDRTKGGWPAFYPQDYVPPYFQKLSELGYYVEPYADARLWNISHNGKKDERYEAEAHKFAVKLKDGRVPTEKYDGVWFYAVMCPAVDGWQRELLSLYRRLTKMSIASLHHDQVGTAPPVACCEQTHGHDLNDPACWLQQGYRPFYKKFRAALPGYPLSTEEMSEPYLDLFDGGHVWRWTHADQVPAFQAVYGLSCQYLQIDFDTHGKGDYASNFVKMANSLVTGLKIGKFIPSELYNADAKRLFAKKMAHLRLALNPYLNGGEMMHPLEFAHPVPLRTTSWSNFSRINENITMPEVISGSWLYNGVKVHIFVNTAEENRTVEPLGIRGFLCLEGAEKPVVFHDAITLAPLASAVVLDGPRKEADEIQRTLRKIAGFDPGVSFDTLVRFRKARRITAVKGKRYGTSDASGFYNLVKSPSGSHFGNTASNSMISYGIVDFGKEKVSEIVVKLAVPDAYSGKSLELLAGSSPTDCRSVGKFTIPSTGSWENFQDFHFKLDRVLTGENYLIIRFNADACCNFAEWGL